MVMETSEPKNITPYELSYQLVNYIDLVRVVYSLLPRPHHGIVRKGCGHETKMQSCMILCHYIIIHGIGSVVRERTNYFRNIEKISTNIKTPFVITIKRELYYLPYS